MTADPLDVTPRDPFPLRHAYQEGIKVGRAHVAFAFLAGLLAGVVLGGWGR
jgi:hypothetical protein